MAGSDLSDPAIPSFFNGFDKSSPCLDRKNASSTDSYILLKIKMIIYNDIANLFFVIFNNISYNKLEVEKIIY